MEMNDLLRRKMVVWNYSRLHTPEVGATTESNGSVATLLYLPLWPWQGRVKTFPNEGSRGNDTIRIDGLQESDLGCYQCGPADACHQVVVQKEGEKYDYYSYFSIWYL